MQDEDRIAAEAARWHARLAGGMAGPEERAAFAAWRAADPRHAAAAAEMAALWQAAAPRRRGSLARRAVLAAGLAAAAAGGIVLPRRVENWQASQVTVIGERRDVLLPYGVRATLNTDTALAEESDGLRLLRGEAFFAVPDGAFLTVRTAALTVRGAAAAFDLMAGGPRAGVQVSEGVVEAARPDEPLLRVAAGYRLRSAAGAPEQADPLDLAWRQGVLAFRRQRLDAVAAELDRYRTGRIVIPSASLRGRLASGSLLIDRPEAAVEALAGLFGIVKHALPGGLIFLRDG